LAESHDTDQLSPESENFENATTEQV
jgi:hypothetical protein